MKRTFPEMSSNTFSSAQNGGCISFPVFSTEFDRGQGKLYIFPAPFTSISPSSESLNKIHKRCLFSENLLQSKRCVCVEGCQHAGNMQMALASFGSQGIQWVWRPNFYSFDSVHTHVPSRKIWENSEEENSAKIPSIKVPSHYSNFHKGAKSGPWFYKPGFEK